MSLPFLETLRCDASHRYRDVPRSAPSRTSRTTASCPGANADRPRGARMRSAPAAFAQQRVTLVRNVDRFRMLPKVPLAWPRAVRLVGGARRLRLGTRQEQALQVVDQVALHRRRPKQRPRQLAAAAAVASRRHMATRVAVARARAASSLLLQPARRMVLRTLEQGVLGAG